jgi:2-polyprenyl-3-methyl-5-hydroxy-6-metoxy-1,4-benzoquinol methylase
MEKLITRNECPVCGSKKVLKILDLPIESGVIRGFLDWRLPNYFKNKSPFLFNYILNKCTICSAIYHRDVLRDVISGVSKDSRDSDDTILKKYHTKLVNNVTAIYFREILVVRKMLGGKPFDQKILDFGCGWGTWLSLARSFGFNVYGMEIDPVKLEKCKNLHIDIVDFEAEENESLFDFINTEQVFEHLLNPSYFLEKLSSYLKDGGIIRISVPNGLHVEKALRDKSNWMTKNKSSKKSLNAVWPFEHINAYSPITIEYMASQFSLVRYRLSFIEFFKCQNAVMPFYVAFYYALHHSFLNKKNNLYFKKVAV